MKDKAIIIRNEAEIDVKMRNLEHMRTTFW